MKKWKITLRYLCAIGIQSETFGEFNGVILVPLAPTSKVLSTKKQPHKDAYKLIWVHIRIT